MNKLIICIGFILIHVNCPAKETSMIIDELYRNINGFSISEDERTTVRKLGGNPTYGEITYKGAAELLKKLDLKPNDILIDLGSGVGKLVVQVGLDTPAQAIGIELSKTRYEHAASVQKELVNRNLIADKKIQFINQNISDVDLNNATVVFMCSTCFSDELMRLLTDKLSKLKKGFRVITLRKLPEPHQFNLTETLQLPMTWSNSTLVYIYKLA